MPSVDLTDAEFGNLMFVLANAEGKGITWGIVNPLLMKIGQQLQQHQAQRATPPAADQLGRMGGIKLDGEGKEVRHD